MLACLILITVLAAIWNYVFLALLTSTSRDSPLARKLREGGNLVRPVTSVSPAPRAVPGLE